MTERPSIFGDVINPDRPVLPLDDNKSCNDTDDDEAPDEDGLAGSALDFKGPFQFRES